MLDPILAKNDRRANILILLVSVIVFIAVVVLGGVEVQLGGSFDVHILAKFNAIINSLVTLFLIAGLIAVKRGNYRIHRRIMLGAMLLSVLFLVSYICHHLFAGDTKFGGQGPVRLFYFIILVTHI